MSSKYVIIIIICVVVIYLQKRIKRVKTSVVIHVNGRRVRQFRAATTTASGS